MSRADLFDRFKAQLEPDTPAPARRRIIVEEPAKAPRIAELEPIGVDDGISFAELELVAERGKKRVKHKQTRR